MNNTVLCTECGRAFLAPATCAGRRVKCPECSKSLPLPEIPESPLTMPETSPAEPPRHVKSVEPFDFATLKLQDKGLRPASKSGKASNPRPQSSALVNVLRAIMIAVTAIAVWNVINFQNEKARKEQIRQTAFMRYAKLGEPKFMMWLVTKHHDDCYRASTSLGKRHGSFDAELYFELMEQRIKSDMELMGNSHERILDSIFGDRRAQTEVRTVPPTPGQDGNVEQGRASAEVQEEGERSVGTKPGPESR